MAIPAAFAQEKDIVDTAIKAGTFKTLVTAVQKAGLEEALRGEGPFTVLAPTDEAFAAVPEKTLNFLLDNPEELKKVLLYHVIPGAVKAETVVGLTSAETLSGQSLSIKAGHGKVKINGAKVIATDIKASNGIVHVINSVLIPPAEANIVEVAANAGSFKTLIKALEVTGLNDALAGEGPFTVFAPTDEAFSKLPEGVLASLLADPDALKNILLFHVASGEMKAEKVLSKGHISMLQKNKTTIKMVKGSAYIEKAKIVSTDIMASNGVIHVIDSVILPPEKDAVSY